MHERSLAERMTPPNTGTTGTTGTQNQGSTGNAGNQQGRVDKRTAESDTWHRTAKVIEIIGNSKNSFEEAVQNALTDASQSLRHISGADVIKSSVKCEEGRIIEYRVDLKVAFGIERGMNDGSNSMNTGVNR